MKYIIRIKAALRCLFNKPTIFGITFTDVVRLQEGKLPDFLNCNFDMTDNISKIIYETYPFTDKRIVFTVDDFFMKTMNSKNDK